MHPLLQANKYHYKIQGNSHRGNFLLLLVFLLLLLTITFCHIYSLFFCFFVTVPVLQFNISTSELNGTITIITKETTTNCLCHNMVFTCSRSSIWVRCYKANFISQHIYESKCNLSTSSSTSDEVRCVDQDLSLNLLFTVACMVTNISALPVGSILDSYGPKLTGIIEL